MRAFDLRVRFPTGTILVGGHSTVPGGVSLAHSVDHDGRPVIPSTAIRGAMRETLEAVLRGAGRQACDAGTGIDPETATPKDEPRPCVLDNGGPCIPCRLFGTQRARIGASERSFSSLIIGDASLDGEDDVDMVTRPHVAVSRTHRSAEQDRLFQRQTPDLTDRVLVARGHSVEADLERYLEVAARGTTHLGSGRSIGLARVEMDIVWLDDVEHAPEAGKLAAPGGDEVTIRVRLRSPTTIGTADATNNYRATRREIPGSALRGAVGFAIARAMPGPDAKDESSPFDDAVFQSLVDQDNGAHFGFLYPEDGDDLASGSISGPWPLTARVCKSHPYEHPVVDTLLDRIAVAMIETPAHAERVHAGTLRTCPSSGCTGPLRDPKGTRLRRQTLPTRTITRVSIDRRSSSARDGALFSDELLEPGSTFRGTIRNLPPGTSTLLTRALGLPLFVGRGVSSGRGNVSVEVGGQQSIPTVSKRGDDFETALRSRLGQAGLRTDEADRIVPITFLSPYLPAEEDTKALADELGLKVEWVVVARRFVREGGWDQRVGKPFAELAIAAGAVYVARLEQPWRTVEESIRALERNGVGQRRHQGYGHIIVFDPFILTRGNPT